MPNPYKEYEQEQIRNFYSKQYVYNLSRLRTMSRETIIQEGFLILLSFFSK